MSSETEVKGQAGEGDCPSVPPGETGARPASSNSRSTIPGSLIAVLVLYLLFRCGLGAVRLPAHTPTAALVLASILSAAGAIGLPIALIAGLVRLPQPVRTALIAVPLGLLLWLGLGWVTRGISGPGAILISGSGDLGKILAAGGVGLLLASGLREPNLLVPAGFFAAFADFVVVNFGTVKQALSNPKGQALVQAVSAQVPAVHASLTPLTIGPADFLFLGIFLLCAHRFELGLRRNAVVLALVLAVSLLLLQIPGMGPIPALAPMSLAFLALNWKRFRLSRQELWSSALVVALAGGLFLAYFLVMFPAKR